jgi:uncharacterized membrane protein YesL
MSGAPASLRVIGRALVTWWDDWIQMVIVNLVWAVLCLTVILAPPATFGLYSVTHLLRQGQSRGLGGLLEGTRRYFWAGWRWGLLNLAVAIVLVVSYAFYSQIGAAWSGALSGIVLGVSAVWLVVQFYALPFYMEQEQQSLKLALRNGLFTTLAAPGYTLVLALAAAVIVVASVALVGPLFLGGPCLLAILGHCAVHERLVAYGKREPDDAPEPPPESRHETRPPSR